MRTIELPPHIQGRAAPLHRAGSKQPVAALGTGAAWWPSLVTAMAVGAGCGTKANTPSPPPCDQACQDGIALRALRDGLTIAYNRAFPQPPGAPVPNGAQDATVPCDDVHKVHLFGTAVSDPVQAVTSVNLTYDVPGCPVRATDATADENYALRIAGTVTQTGTVSAQSSAYNALVIRATAVTFSGTVYDPAVSYEQTCSIEVVQNGNNISGRLCGRITGIRY